MICFEHPLSERLRGFLRIEYLFNRFHTEIDNNASFWSHHLALFTLFEIMECAGRAEFKLEILQELERQAQKIVNYHDDYLDGKQNMLEIVQDAIIQLQSVQQKFGQHLRENEWLMVLKQRLMISGGVCPSDLPSYYFWQQQSFEKRRADLEKWIKSMLPTENAISILMKILRNNIHSVQCMATKGNYQHKSLAQNAHMLSISIDKSCLAIPEVSANKYFTHIRFLEASQELTRGKPITHDISFKLIISSFDTLDNLLI